MIKKKHKKNNIDALPIEIGRFVKNKVASYMVMCTVTMVVIYIVAASSPSQNIGTEKLIHKAIAFYIIMAITVICGCMKTVAEALGTMICCHVPAMIAMTLYMFMKKRLSPIISGGYLAVILAVLCVIMHLMISKREKKKRGCFN